MQMWLAKPNRATQNRQSKGFTVPELLIALTIGTVMTVVALPMFLNTLNNMRLTDMVSNLSGTLSSTRYQSIMKNQDYSLVITTPANTYVVTNLSTGTASASIPLANGQTIVINGGAAATYTYTFCPNGTVYGNTGNCPGEAGFASVATPALSVTYKSRQVNLAVSSVGNVTTTIIK